MMQVTVLSFALLVPWVLGFAFIRPFLRKRKGYIFFAMGAGYVLGWFVATLLLRAFDYFGRPFNFYEVAIIECIVMIPLLLLKAPQIGINDSRVENSASRLVYFLSGIIILLLIYRWGLTAIDLFSKPVFPWDGWLSWSAKAKIFYFHQEIPTLSAHNKPFWSFASSDFVSAYGARHPFFISLIQTYVALAWGSWDDQIVNLPWLGANIAMFLCVYGGLRYLNVRSFTSLVAGYLVVSLPVVDVHASLGAYADLWVSFAMLITVFLLAILLSLKERRVILLLLFFCIIVYLTKNTALIFLISLFGVIVWYFLGWGGFMAIVAVFSAGLYLMVSVNWLGKGAFNFLQQYFSEFNLDIIKYNPVIEQVWRQWIMFDNWHYAVFSGLLSLVLLLFKKSKNNSKLLAPLIVASLSLFLTMLMISFLTSKMSGAFFVGYFNRVSLYFIPVFALLPIAVYQSRTNTLCSKVNS